MNELLRRARSIRRFDASRPVEREVLCEMVEALRYIPSASNLQALKYYLSRDPRTNALIRANTKWARLLPEYDGPAQSENPTAYIFICIDKSVSDKIDFFIKDTGIAAQTINLLACERGLGCCIMSSFDSPKASRELSLPENIKPVLLCALGYPAEAPVAEDARDGNVTYYRTADGTHHVPKRSAQELIINANNSKEQI